MKGYEVQDSRGNREMSALGIVAFGPKKQTTFDKLDDAKEAAEGHYRRTRNPQDASLEWRTVNDGSKPGNIQVYDLWDGGVYTQIAVNGPSCASL